MSDDIPESALNLAYEEATALYIAPKDCDEHIHNSRVIARAMHKYAESQMADLRKYAKLIEHKVITCGVAASHPNANLAHTGAYADKWDSPQAQDVRDLRAERDSLKQQVADLQDELADALGAAKILREFS